MMIALAPRLAHFRPAGLPPPRRIPFPALALAVCLLFTIAGIAVLDDYGVGWDAPDQRRLAERNAAYITGDRNALPGYHDRFYGIVFELPLYLVERLLGLQDSRDIYLSRHLITHLFFIVGGFVCGLLAWRMFNNRWLALLAMLLFLLHPRLYAHSFFNSKDIPFTVIFVIALYLTHRAFRRNTVWAFVLLGIVVGLAVNTRPFALLFIAAVLALRGLDWWQSPGNRREHILLTAGSFSAAALLVIYVSHPWYWENPLRFFDGLQTLSRHPAPVANLFQGQIFPSNAVPADFIPVWFGITSPPALLVLGAAGIAAVLWRGWQAPGRVLRNGELRFLFLLLACFALPVAAVIVLQTHIYDHWRLMYFLWGPFCLLAAAGLSPLVHLGRSRSRILRIALYGLAAAGLGGALYAIVSLHPHQQIYFNLLVNRAAPGELERQYDMDVWHTSQLQSLEYLLERYPGEMLYVYANGWKWPDINRMLLPAADRERIVLSDVRTADFYIGTNNNTRARKMPPEPAVYNRQAYGSIYLTVTAPRLVWGAGPRPGEEVYRTAYQSLIAATGPAARSDFDVYFHNNALYYVKENCSPADAQARFSLHLYPANQDDLPPHRRKYGFDNRNFDFAWRGGFFDGKCITQEPLPDYSIVRIRTGQSISLYGELARLWQAEIDAAAQTRMQEIAAGLENPTLAASDFFDVYMDSDNVVYRREPCSPADVAAKFFLHATPLREDDIPENRRQAGFNNLDFNFYSRGVNFGGKCLAIEPLPDYPVSRISTGQHVTGNGEIWRADIEIPASAQMRKLEAGLKNPVPAASGFFDVYLDGNIVVYRREPCNAADTDAKFYLHIIPQDVTDLPADSREIGFANRDFWFADRGVISGNKCLATASLPDYDIDRIRTGQHLPGQGNLWQTDFRPGQ